MELNNSQKEIFLTWFGWEKYGKISWVKHDWLNEPVNGPNWYRNLSLEDAYDTTIKELFPETEFNTIYLIERIWIDRHENNHNNAVGYIPHSFVETKEEAEDICLKGKEYTNEHCWAITEPMTEFKMKEIKKYKS